MPGPLAAVGLAALWAGLTLVLKNVWKWVVANAPSFFAHVLGAVGLYFLVAEPATEFGLEWARDQFTGLSGTVAETLYYLDVDNYLSAVFSAYNMRAAGNAAKQVILAKKPAATP